MRYIRFIARPGKSVCKFGSNSFSLSLSLLLRSANRIVNGERVGRSKNFYNLLRILIALFFSARVATRYFSGIEYFSLNCRRERLPFRRPTARLRTPSDRIFRHSSPDDFLVLDKSFARASDIVIVRIKNVRYRGTIREGISIRLRSYFGVTDVANYRHAVLLIPPCPQGFTVAIKWYRIVKRRSVRT